MTNKSKADAGTPDSKAGDLRTPPATGGGPFQSTNIGNKCNTINNLRARPHRHPVQPHPDITPALHHFSLTKRCCSTHTTNVMQITDYAETQAPVTRVPGMR